MKQHLKLMLTTYLSLAVVLFQSATSYAARPVANAGPDQTVNEFQTVVLDGSGSFDPDGDTITFNWVQAGGPSVSLDPSDPVHPRFTAPAVSAAGALITFVLQVRDGTAVSSDTVEVTIVNSNDPPIADAGVDQTLSEGSSVTLDGSATFDGDSPTIFYSWTQIAGSSVTLSNPTAVQPNFITLPVGAGGAVLTFRLDASDGLENSSDLVNITVTNVNNPPVAIAGDDQKVKGGSPVTLDGSRSFDPDSDPLHYRWEQSNGPPVLLSETNAVQPSFTAPTVDSRGATLEFVLYVDDGLDGSKDTVLVFVEEANHPPFADAGQDQTVNEGTIVTLDGTFSFDPDGDRLSFNWIQLSGPVVRLEASSPTPSFTAPLVGAGGEKLVFQLIVNDGLADNKNTEDPKNDQNDARVVITVLNVNDPPACNLAQANPSLLWPPNHKLIPVGIIGVADPDNRIAINILNVYQDEPTNGLGDGDTSPDAVILDNLLLRAERSGGGNGRVYQILFSADDGQGGTCRGSVNVSVPHNMKPGNSAVDDGQLYDSTLP